MIDLKNRREGRHRNQRSSMHVVPRYSSLEKAPSEHIQSGFRSRIPGDDSGSVGFQERTESQDGTKAQDQTRR